MKPRFIVLGSNSFSGASFVEHLLSQNIDVVGMSRSAEPARCFLPYQWPPSSETRGSFRFVEADLNTRVEEILRVTEEFRPEAFVNFAAQGMVAQSWEHPLDWYRTNLMGNIALSDGLRRFPWLHRYVHIGTPEVYGNCSGDVTEDAAFNPSTPYAASRAACDLHLRTYFKQYGFPVVWTRAANVYGPGQQLYRIIPRTILYIKLGRKIQLHGGGHSVRSFIHIRDVAAATLAIARSGVPGETYHLSTSLYLSIRELVERICERMHVRFDDVVEVVGERPGKDAAYLLNSQKARSAFGWTDQISLDAGIDECIAWVDRDFDQIRQQPFDYIHKA
jgi:dTDP-glucose 4,6-dehydratase